MSLMQKGTDSWHWLPKSQIRPTPSYLVTDNDGYNYEYDYEKRIVKSTRDPNDTYDALNVLQDTFVYGSRLNFIQSAGLRRISPFARRIWRTWAWSKLCRAFYS
ncbi:MAG TPA: hypothetical protein VMW16_02325 [Sedimentisphaerales bacterium]|nr:hypothetical protein [Sedimentisphaerales bacterium]